MKDLQVEFFAFKPVCIYAQVVFFMWKMSEASKATYS